MRDLRRSEGGAVAAEPAAPNPRRDRQHDGGLRAGVAPRPEVVAAMGHQPGTSFDVGDGATLGRSNGADIRIDDPFASSAPARIFQRGHVNLVDDIGLENGTYLNGRQL